MSRVMSIHVVGLHTKFMDYSVCTVFINFYHVSGLAVFASQADRLYNRMKKEMSSGGT